MDTPRPTRKHTSGSSRDGAPSGPNESADRSTLEILMSIADDTRHLLQKEVELARQEIVQALMAKAKAAAALAAAGIIGLMVLVFAGLTAAAALDNVLPPWGSRLVVTGGFALLAIVAVLFGLARLRKPGLMPEQTKRTLKEGEEWAIAQLQR
ncbi:MAG TPA: phage holin family protein [Actinomycetota bacterium]|nr:phage holin family protein [Actinomycetota bacterium]